MKIGGIIAIIFGAINLIAGIAGMGSQYADQASGKIGFGIGATLLGVFLISRAEKNKKEQEEKDKWNNG